MAQFSHDGVPSICGYTILFAIKEHSLMTILFAIKERSLMTILFAIKENSLMVAWGRLWETIFFLYHLNYIIFQYSIDFVNVNVIV